MTPSLDGKIALITGGCSGIGLATVELFLAEGAEVLVADLQEKVGADLVARHGAKVRFQRCDVTVEKDIEAAVAAAVEAFGGLDILFNNAGAGGSPSRIEEMTGEGWDFTQSLLLRSVALGIRYAVAPMRARGGGSIVNTASIAALQAGGAPIAYSVAKAGVLHLTKVAAAELGRYNIRVNAICPGFILTSIFASGLGVQGEQAAQVNAALEAMAPQAQPLAAAGRGHDIAKTALYFASEQSAFVTGAHVVVDGGLTVGPRHSWDPNAPRMMEGLRATAASE